MKNSKLFILVCAICKSVLLLILMMGCKSKSQTPHLFTLLDNEKTGIHFKNVSVENEQINILTYEYLYNGGGVAIGDVNNDGLKDIYFTSNNLENKLYLNKGNLKFEDITEKSGAGCKKGWKTGVSMVDINGDGWIDIYVCKSADGNPENRRNILLINQGNATFKDEAKQYGLDDIGYSTQAAFFDMDKDGDLDMFLLNHSLIEVSNTIGINPMLRNARDPNFSNKLFKNEGGKFEDISNNAGIVGGMANYGLGINISDFNNDGWPDVYVTNDYAENDHMYLNLRNNTFADTAYKALGHMSNFSMGVDIADYNNDALSDIFTLDMLPEDNARQKLLYGPNEYDKFNLFVKAGLHYQYMRNMLQLNNGNGTYSEIGQLANISNTDWSWAPLVADYDNDGNQDLFVTNGYKRDFTNMDFLKYKADEQLKSRNPRNEAPKPTMAEIINKMPTNNFHNYCFRNTGNLKFENVSKEWGFDRNVLNNGAAYADLDNDGDLELITNNIDQEAFVYRNNSDKILHNNFIQVTLQGDGLNRNALGAKVTVYAKNKLFFKEQSPTRGFQSSIDTDLSFGLGSLSQVDSVEVIWPSGKKLVATNLQINQRIILKEINASAITNSKPLKRNSPYFEMDASPLLPFAHKENEFIDFNVQSFIPNMLSTEGPRMANADVNGDGLTDVFICAASQQSSRLFIQMRNGTFVEKPQKSFEETAYSEDIDASFLDADNDGDQDLMVVSGGNEVQNENGKLVSRLFLNSGNGQFVWKADAIPPFAINASCVKIADVDGDGDMDAFIGARSVPSQYPISPQSYLLLNDGKGKFTDATLRQAPQLQKVGMVTDALWIDLNNDKQQDLLVVGEWMPIKVFINSKGKLLDQSTNFIDQNIKGWWSRLAAADFDHDGDIDFIVGNRGLNSQIKPSMSEPCRMLFKDFDNNGSVDGLMSYYIQGKEYPALSRDEITDQLPVLRKKFNDYASYSNATISQFFSKEQFSNASKLEVTEARTMYAQNDGKGKFVLTPLPIQAQFAPVYAIQTIDANNDGILDVILCGNFEKTRVAIGKMDANYGQLFLGKGNGKFYYLPQTVSGFNIQGAVKDLLWIKEGKKTTLLVARNNASLISFHQKQ